MLLDVRDLNAGYGQGTVVQGVDLQIGEGEVLGLLGRNGAGKSTTVMALMGLVSATGEVSVAGRSVLGLRTDQIARSGVALVPQGRRIWGALSVREHLRLAGRSQRRSDTGRSWTSDGVHELFPRLAERRDQLAGQMSGGEQQMLAIARALLGNPRLILLDEPSEGLAPAIVEHIGGAIRSMVKSGVSVLLVEQDLNLAFTLADDIAVMEKGSIVHRGTTTDFRQDPDRAHRLLGVV